MIGPWTPIFRGVDHALGTNSAATYGTHSANAIRIDLHDPELELFVTPPLTNVPQSRETALQTPSEFAQAYGLQVAINSGHFSPAGYTSPSGTPASVSGLAISEGRIVSTQSDTNNSLSALLFTTNNQATLLLVNWPPTNTAGVYNAVSGMYPILSDGVNISYAYTNLSDSIHRPQPRTGFGLSEDGRYLILLTIDGRQNDFSDGALDWETADFLIRFGAHNGINMDGGGSTCVVKVEHCGEPVDLNQNSFQFSVNRPGSQRPTGLNFGVRAKPVRGPNNPGFINNVEVAPGRFTAEITWTTVSNGSTRVEYGPTESLGLFSPLDSTPTQLHSARLTGLNAGQSYYFQVLSMADGVEYAQAGCFATTNFPMRIFGLTNAWKFATNNFEGLPWQSLTYDDSGWLGPGPGLLYVEDSVNVAPRNTGLPPLDGVPVATLPVTYYFRTRFNFSDNPAGVTLVFSNYLDDGAVFYLNGSEIYRLRMPPPPAVILNSTLATGYSCSNAAAALVGDACTVCPVLFSVGTTNLIVGENVLAVEVHNYRANSPDIVFGSALSYLGTRPSEGPPSLLIRLAGSGVQVWWNGTGYTLQESDSPFEEWRDLPGTTATNAYTTSNTGSGRFFRLKQ